jgi:hypothetical protein
MGAHSYQTSFAGGVLSPHLFTRVDFQKYPNGAEEILNAVVKVTGGAARRAGSMFVAQAKSFSAFQSDAFQNDAFQTSKGYPVRLVPFVFNTDQSYVLEFGHHYIRFYRNRAPIFGTGTGAELVTNGGFGAGLTGWSVIVAGGGTVTDGGGFASLQPGGSGTGSARINQQISGLTPGTRYSLAFRVDNSPLTFSIGTTEGSAEVIPAQSLTAGLYRVIFVAPSSGTVWISWFNAAVSTDGRLDDVSMQEAAPLEIETPYDAAHIHQLRFTQSADTLYIAHSEYEPRKLTRLSDQLWTLQIIAFQPGPSEEVPITPAATLTPAATTGANVSFTTDVSAFLAADINKLIRSRGGLAVIKVVDGATQVHADIIQPFLDTTPVGQGTWQLEGSPSTNLTLPANPTVDAIVTVTAAAAAFRATDVGAFIKGNDGLLEIETVTSDTVVQARVLALYTGTTFTSGAWTLERASWSTTLGFPGVVNFFEQRLWYASTKNRPQTIWGSVAGDFENFTVGPNDDDSVEFTIASNQLDLIRWMKSIRSFLIGTLGSEYRCSGGNDSAITPSNVMFTPESAYGSDYAPDALRTGIAIIFVQRGRRQIREEAFQYESDSYQAADLTILAEHLFRGGVHEIARMAAPDSFIFAVLDNGKMAVAAYERPENVVAWTLFETLGDYVAVCVIPGKCGDGDEVWTAVERELAGGAVRTIEVFDGQLNTDCALVYRGSGLNPITTLTGLPHLDTEDVDVRYKPTSAFAVSAFQTDAFQDNQPGTFVATTVVNSTITLAEPAEEVEVGLHYETRIKTLRAELAGPTGTGHFRRKRSNSIYVRYLCSHGTGMLVEDEAVPASGLDIRDFHKTNLGWDTEGQVTIKQTQPFPMIVLGVSWAWQIDDGDAPGLSRS